MSSDSVFCSVDLLFHPETKQAERILNEILPGVIELFLAKNKDYKIEGIDIAATLGVRGQWSDMFRKIAKLKQEMWDQDGSGLQFETAEEVIKDLIGHCLLSLLFLKDAKPKTVKLSEGFLQTTGGYPGGYPVVGEANPTKGFVEGRPFVGTARKIVDNPQA
jgi:hypothetical protein